MQQIFTGVNRTVCPMVIMIHKKNLFPIILYNFWILCLLFVSNCERKKNNYAICEKQLFSAKTPRTTHADYT